MTDLNLNFDTGNKNVPLSNNTGNSNINLQSGNLLSPTTDFSPKKIITEIPNFWKTLANQPDNLERTWNSLQQIMKKGAIDPITKELIGSASKRIYGNILDSENDIDKISIRDIIFGFVLCVILFLAVNWFI